MLKRDKDKLAQIDISALNSFVEVDAAGRIITVEPGMRIGQLSSILAARDWRWTIPVVPEMEALSIGGLICGAGLETSSHRYGIMGNTPVEMELVLSSEEVINCSRDQNSDLFFAIPWSHGTIGFLTAIKFPLIPAAKYVRTEYHVAESIDEAQRLLSCPDHLFVEAIAFGHEKFVVMHGDRAEGGPDPNLGPVNSIGRWYKPYFYAHAKSMLRRAQRGRRRGGDPEDSRSRPLYTDFIPTRDYYHRHSRAQFWGTPLHFPITGSRLWIFLFGWMFPVLEFHIIQRIVLPFVYDGGYSKLQAFCHIVEDYGVPVKHFRAGMDFVHKETGCYPIWLCPIRAKSDPGMSRCKPGLDSELYINFGVYGSVSKEAQPNFHPENTLRKFEEFLIEKQGFTGTYSDMYLSREQFRQIFDMSLYDKVRVKHGCEDAFPEVYDKIIKDAIRLL